MQPVHVDGVPAQDAQREKAAQAVQRLEAPGRPGKARAEELAARERAADEQAQRAERKPGRGIRERHAASLTGAAAA